MAGNSKFILYDLPTKGKPFCWSLNAWKGRLVLNFKGLPYSTEWVEYPDIKPRFQELGIEPNTPEQNSNEYTIPAVRMPDGSHIMESMAIAHAVEKYQAEPSLHLDSNYIGRAQGVVGAVFKALVPIALPRVAADLLPERSAEYFIRTRSASFGMPLLTDFAAKGGDWKQAEVGLEQAKQLLHENASGPYVEGDVAGYADLVLAGAWQMLKIVDKDGDVFPRIMKYDESLEKHYEACKKWLERDDH